MGLLAHVSLEKPNGVNDSKAAKTLLNIITCINKHATEQMHDFLSPWIRLWDTDFLNSQ